LTALDTALDLGLNNVALFLHNAEFKKSREETNEMGAALAIVVMAAASWRR
jgi:hypothetical protein